jgi:hypothetical protein
MALLQSPAFIYFLFGIASGLGLKLRKRLEQRGCLLAALYNYFFVIGLVMVLIFHLIFKPFHFAWLLMGIFAVYSLEIYDFIAAVLQYIHQVIQNIHYYMLLRSNNSFSQYEHKATSEGEQARSKTHKEYKWQDYKQQQNQSKPDDKQSHTHQQQKQQQSKQQSQQEQAHTPQGEMQGERRLRLEYQHLLNLSGDHWTALALEKAWKKKRSELHPDRHQSKPAAVIAQKTLEFQKCQAAYAYLKLHIPSR